MQWYSPNVDVKYVGGKDPEMHFLNDSGEVVKVGRDIMRKRKEIHVALSLSLSLSLSLDLLSVYL